MDIIEDANPSSSKDAAVVPPEADATPSPRCWAWSHSWTRWHLLRKHASTQRRQCLRCGMTRDRSTFWPS